MVVATILGIEAPRVTLEELFSTSSELQVSNLDFGVEAGWMLARAALRIRALSVWYVQVLPLLVEFTFLKDAAA